MSAVIGAFAGVVTWLLLGLPGPPLIADDGWLFDPANAREFYLVKGFLGVVAVVLYLAHMTMVFGRLRDRDQQLRYLCLLGMALLITSASAEQVRESADVNWRNVGALGMVVLLIVTAAVSIVADKRRRRSEVT